MAMIRNMEIKMAVATKPNEIAFIDVPRFFHVPPDWDDGLGCEPV